MFVILELVPNGFDKDGKKVSITVINTFSGRYEGSKSSTTKITIGSISLTGKTKWELLDNLVKRIFKASLEQYKVYYDYYDFCFQVFYCLLY